MANMEELKSKREADETQDLHPTVYVIAGPNGAGKTTADMAVARVRARVRQGGHNVPESVIRRRYQSGLINSFRLYRPLAHIWRVYDASYLPPKIVAHEERGEIKVLDATIFENIMQDIGA